MTAATKCPHCLGTGMLAGSYDLDCTHCDVAHQRLALDAIMREHAGPETELSDLLWAIHQRAFAMGMAAAAELAKAKQDADITDDQIDGVIIDLNWALDQQESDDMHKFARHIIAAMKAKP